jgi:hypothetical protein
MEDRMDTSTIDAALDTYFDERQRRLIDNCRAYADSDPAGLPGHQLMLIIAQFDAMFRFYIEHDRLPTYDELEV